MMQEQSRASPKSIPERASTRRALLRSRAVDYSDSEVPEQQPPTQHLQLIFSPPPAYSHGISRILRLANFHNRITEISK